MTFGNRHRIFPSILESCKTINEEGSPILYGENHFEMEETVRMIFSNCTIYRSWNPGKENMAMIRKLNIGTGLYKLGTDCISNFGFIASISGLEEVEFYLKEFGRHIHTRMDSSRKGFLGSHEKNRIRNRSL